jgi:hypothetical protein
MGVESRQDLIDDGQVLNKTSFLLVAATLTAQQQVVEYDTDVGGACAVTLPPVIEAMGKMYSISLVEDGGDLTVQDQDDSRDWTDIVLTADDDYVLLYSDGRKWFSLDEQST